MNNDILHPSYQDQKNCHKLDRLIPTPDTYFMDVKCGACLETTTIFSHAQNVIECKKCKNILTKPTGGKCKIT